MLGRVVLSVVYHYDWNSTHGAAYPRDSPYTCTVHIFQGPVHASHWVLFPEKLVTLGQKRGGVNYRVL